MKHEHVDRIQHPQVMASKAQTKKQKGGWGEE